MTSSITPAYVEELRRRREVFRLRSKAYAKALVLSEARRRGLDVETVGDDVIEGLSIDEQGEVRGLETALLKLSTE